VLIKRGTVSLNRFTGDRLETSDDFPD